MSPAIIEILVLAGIAIFLVLRLKNVLGTREGFEKPPLQDAPLANNNRDFRETFFGKLHKYRLARQN